MWVRPARADKAGSGILAALIDNHSNGDLKLSQIRADKAGSGRYEARLRTTRKPAGDEIQTGRDSIRAELTHVVLTRDARSLTRIYINGVEQAEQRITGALTNWRETVLTLANDLSGRHPWLGEYQHLALYNRALSSAEVMQHFADGPDPALDQAHTN